MNSRRLSTLLALPSAIVLAACSGSTSGKGSTGSSSAPGGASTGAAASGKPTDAVGLGGLMQSAIAGVTSAHIALDINAAGQKVTGQGDEKLAAGKLVAMDITEQLPGGSGALRLIIVGGKTYAKLPPSLNKGTKPYVLVSASSSNPTIRSLASSLDSALSSASIGSVGAFITAAKSVKPVGEETITGVKTTHYAVVVDIAKLPAELPGKDALTSSGLKTLPLDLFVDEQGRPIRVTEDFTVQGQQVSTNVTVSDYNKPVTVTAPPASQVSTD
jgi:LppX_LprAFG lipoprotein